MLSYNWTRPRFTGRNVVLIDYQKRLYRLYTKNSDFNKSFNNIIHLIYKLKGEIRRTNRPDIQLSHYREFSSWNRFVNDRGAPSEELLKISKDSSKPQFVFVWFADASKLNKLYFQNLSKYFWNSFSWYELLKIYWTNCSYQDNNKISLEEQQALV